MNIDLEELRSYADKGLLESFILSQGLLPMQVLELLIEEDNGTVRRGFFLIQVLLVLVCLILF